MARLSKAYSAREKKTSRCFTAILYDGMEGCEFEPINRLPYFWDLYYAIRHDRDVYHESDYDKYLVDHNGEEPEWKIGDLKKPHYHFIGYSSSPVMLGRAATKFGIPSQYVQIVHNKNDAIQYLVHLNNPDKFQYSIDEVITNDEKIQAILTRVPSTEEKASILTDFIFSPDCFSMESLVKFAIASHCWDELRRGQHIYTQLLREKRFSVNSERFYDVSFQGFKELYYD